LVTFMRTLGIPEVRDGYLNLTDNTKKTYGHLFPAHKTKMIVIDHNGRNSFTQKHNDNQLWGTLNHWYADTRAKAGDTAIVNFDSTERVDGHHVLHLGLFDPEGGKREQEKSTKAQTSPDEPFLTPTAADIAEPNLPPRHSIKTYRILRDSALSRWLKNLYSYQCQICGTTIEISADERYAEAHHIRPLGEPHNGPDITANMLVLCPNHHAMCDLGVIRLTLKELTVSDQHHLSDLMLNYHNTKIASQNKSSDRDEA